MRVALLNRILLAGLLALVAAPSLFAEEGAEAPKEEAKETPKEEAKEAPAAEAPKAEAAPAAQPAAAAETGAQSRYVYVDGTKYTWEEAVKKFPGLKSHAPAQVVPLEEEASAEAAKEAPKDDKAAAEAAKKEKEAAEKKAKEEAKAAEKAAKEAEKKAKEEAKAAEKAAKDAPKAEIVKEETPPAPAKTESSGKAAKEAAEAQKKADEEARKAAEKAEKEARKAAEKAKKDAEKAAKEAAKNGTKAPVIVEPDAVQTERNDLFAARKQRALEEEIAKDVRRLMTPGYKEAQARLISYGKPAVPFLIDAMKPEDTTKESFKGRAYQIGTPGRYTDNRPLDEIAYEVLDAMIRNHSTFRGEIPARDVAAWQSFWAANKDSIELGKR